MITQPEPQPAPDPEPDDDPDDAALLDPLNVVIVAAVASGMTHAAAADAAGCSTRTVRRRVAEPTVRAALDNERRRLTEQVADALAGRSLDAIDRLASIMTDGNDRDAVSAARVVLDQALRHRDAVWIADRVADAEAAIAAADARPQFAPVYVPGAQP